MKTRITELFGVEHPIVQTGMGWVSDAGLTAATANAGGLGILACAPMTFEQMRQGIDDVAAATDAPFGANIRTDAPDIDARVDLLIEKKVKVASFAMAPREDLVKRLQDAGIVVIPTVGARRHAEKVAAWGVDAIIAQGAEGGGHTGEVPTTILIRQVAEAVDVPVLAAGGIVDGAGMAGMLVMGAEGIAMGTRFLLSAESPVPDNVKQIYYDTKVTGTVRTSAIDGWPQRVIRTEVIERLEKSRLLSFPRAAANALRFRQLTGTPLRELVEEGLAMRKSQGLTLSQMAMAANAPMLTKATMVDGHPEVGIMPTGMGLGSIDRPESCKEIIDTMMRECEEALARWT